MDSRPQLGGLLAGMLRVMSDRGPDSAGFAVYGEGHPGRVKLTLRGPNLDGLTTAISDAHGVAVPLLNLPEAVVGLIFGLWQDLGKRP